MILIYSHKTSARLEYILKFIFEDMYKVEYQLTSDMNRFEKSGLAKINYSSDPIPGTLHIVPIDLLFETDILQVKICVETWNNQKIFFQTKSSDIPFDIFAASFS